MAPCHILFHGTKGCLGSTPRTIQYALWHLTRSPPADVFTPLCLRGCDLHSRFRRDRCAWWNGQMDTTKRRNSSQSYARSRTSPVSRGRFSSAGKPDKVTAPCLHCRRCLDEACRYDAPRHCACHDMYQDYGATETQRALGYYIVPDTASDAGFASCGTGSDKEIFPLGKGIEDVRLRTECPR